MAQHAGRHHHLVQVHRDTVQPGVAHLITDLTAVLLLITEAVRHHRIIAGAVALPIVRLRAHLTTIVAEAVVIALLRAVRVILVAQVLREAVAAVVAGSLVPLSRNG